MGGVCSLNPRPIDRRTADFPPSMIAGSRHNRRAMALSTMSADIQFDYESRLTGYANLVHGNTPPGLAPKLAIHRELLRQQHLWQNDLWRIEPLLLPLFRSSEVDLHLSIARLLEAPGRSDRSLFKFLSFCDANRTKITWKNGGMSSRVVADQIASLEQHRSTIASIMGRRDRFFAHLDKEYFIDPGKIYTDYPLEDEGVVDLANAMIEIVRVHEQGLRGSVSINLAEFYTISVDNMVRNLRTARGVNFPDDNWPGH
jgi:hypothetical protein